MAIDTVEAQFAVEQAEWTACARWRQQQMADLHVRAGNARRSAAGTARRRAADHHRDQPGAGGRPDDPKAEFRIVETQAKDVWAAR